MHIEPAREQKDKNRVCAWLFYKIIVKIRIPLFISLTFDWATLYTVPEYVI